MMNIVCRDKVKLLVFLAMVVACATEAERKAEGIDLVVDATTKFLDFWEFLYRKCKQGLLRHSGPQFIE